MSYRTELQFIKGVGPRMATLLQKLDLYTVEDFLFYFPRSYDDRRQLPKVATAEVGKMQSLVGRLYDLRFETTATKTSLIRARLVDGTGSIMLIWFNQPYLKAVLKDGIQLLVQGKIERHPHSHERQMKVSEFETLFNDVQKKQSVGLVVPIYGLVKGLYQYKMRQLARDLIAMYLSKFPETLPTRLRKNLGLLPLQDALRHLHFPKTLESYNRARYRLVFEEFFYFQIEMGRRTSQVEVVLEAPELSGPQSLIRAYEASRPYRYTAAQKRVIAEIMSDLRSRKSMNRLLQGDVGSGKTDVAISAMLMAIESGYSAAIMAPTQILAEQHYLKLQRLTASLNVAVVLAKGNMTKKERQALSKGLQNESHLIFVGTHALIQDTVSIPNLGVTVIDEQHRFGVLQRQALRLKGYFPHCLFMTATPIPRSFMLTCFGDLDKSVMDEMPPGRQNIETHFVRPGRSQLVYSTCLEHLCRGKQVYVVFPLVETSEKLDLKSAVENFDVLREGVFKDYSVGLLHGRLSPREKSEIMAAFQENKIQVLISTTVIEVGIDVPNATVMVIQDAHRYGLSQLHQLRGRVGRGAEKSYCFLIGDPKTDTGKQRLRAMVDSNDGFKIAEYDVLIRGPGDMLGLRQSGVPEFRLGHILRDEQILRYAKVQAEQFLAHNPELHGEDGQLIMRHLGRYRHQDLESGGLD